MLVGPGLCFLVGLIIGILGTIVTITGIALYVDNKRGK